jgi:hypothetical protein
VVRAARFPPGPQSMRKQREVVGPAGSIGFHGTF